MCMSSISQGTFIMSEDITEEKHGTVLNVVKLDMVENVPWAEAIQAATFGGKAI